MLNEAAELTKSPLFFSTLALNRLYLHSNAFQKQLCFLAKVESQYNFDNSRGFDTMEYNNQDCLKICISYPISSGCRIYGE